MALPGIGGLSHPHRGSSQVNGDRVSLRSSPRTCSIHRLWRRNECHTLTLKRVIWPRTFQSKTPEGILPDGTKKDGKYQSVCWEGGTMI